MARGQQGGGGDAAPAREADVGGGGQGLRERRPEWKRAATERILAVGEAEEAGQEAAPGPGRFGFK